MALSERPTPWRPTPEPPKPNLEPLLGIAIVAATDLAVAGLLYAWIRVPTSELYGRILPSMALYNVPIIQWSWIAPIYVALRIKYPVRSKAVLITASVITLLGAACWGVLAFSR